MVSVPDAPVGERTLTLGVFASRGGSWWHLTFVGVTGGSDASGPPTVEVQGTHMRPTNGSEVR